MLHYQQKLSSTHKTTDPIIKSPTYNLVNNSGRPVKISLDKFTPSANNSAALPSNFDLTLDVTGDKVVTQSTSLVKVVRSQQHQVTCLFWQTV
jgi:hypothetical protein